MTVIFFSKDRPLQLDAALRSWQRHCKDASSISIKVLYKASTSRLLSLYRRLMLEHPAVDFVREEEFRRDVLVLLEQQDYVGFVVDDSIFVRDFSVADVTSALARHAGALGFSLRLGRNTVYWYMMDRLQKVPEFEAEEEFALKYRWPGAEWDFAYPLELSSSIYRGEQILPLLKDLEFKNPNTLEEAMYQNIGRFRESHPCLLCPKTSLAFAVPVNRVQEEVKTNRAGSNPVFSAEALAALFAEGQRIDTAALDGFTPRGCHQEVELKITPSAEPVPLVSVIMPCYNQAQYLAEAVASVIAQTFTDWEIIIVNDGSPDDTSAVARRLMKQYEGRRIRLLEKKNGGLATARNAGIRTAAGAYILPLDADDKIAPAMLEKTVALLEENPAIAIAYTDIAHFGATEKIVEAAEFDFGKLGLNNQLNYCSLYRREVWEQAGGYRSGLYGYEDWDFWISGAEQGFVARRIPGALLQYRVKDSSMYTDALAHDKALRARIVLNHPGLYDAKKQEEARAIWSNPPLPPPPGAPKVSVIVPTFNRPGRLQETLRSIAGQTLRDFEIIVVNDSGVDVAAVIARCEAGVEIVHLRHNVNRGLAAARNTGLRHARGRYIAFLDDDDIFLPDHLRSLSDFLESSGKTAAYTDAWCAEEELAEGRYRVARREVRYSADWDNDRILVQNLAPVLCFMHERSLGVATGEFDEQLTTHEDWDYWIRLSRLCAPVHIKNVTCEFRLRKDGSSMTSGRRADFLRTTRMVYKKHHALAAGNKTLRKQQRRFLRGLEDELGAPRRLSFGALLRRLVRGRAP
ncbi:MAG: glycosyltransferase family 2 protein [Limisphaerales bacterium]